MLILRELKIHYLLYNYVAHIFIYTSPFRLLCTKFFDLSSDCFFHFCLLLLLFRIAFQLSFFLSLIQFRYFGITSVHSWFLWHGVRKGRYLECMYLLCPTTHYAICTSVTLSSLLNTWLESPVLKKLHYVYFLFWNV